MLEEELLAVVQQERSPRRQAAMLRQLAPILARDNTYLVRDLTNSTDRWLARAASAALVYASEDERPL